MHCPRCGRSFVSEDVNFCKHCGLALDSVKDILAPSLPVQDSPPDWLSIRVGADPRSRGGLYQSIYLLMVSFLPVLLAIVQGVSGFTLLPAFILIRVFYILLALPVLRFTYAVYEAKQEWKPTKNVRIVAGANKSELRAAPGVVHEAIDGRRLDTAEIIQPPSIAEPTTKLLGKLENDS